jgi:hypothetical protein
MFFSFILFFQSCKQDYGTRGDCNPIDPAMCSLPFPSDFYLDVDEDVQQLNFSSEALPVNIDDVAIRTDYLNELHGYSIGASLYTYLEDATLEGVVQWPELDGYMNKDVKTIIINTKDNSRVPHHVELEYYSTQSQGNSLFILRPMIPLEYNTTYVVGIRNIKNTQDQTISASENFSLLRDHTRKLQKHTDNTDILRQTSIYNDVIFPTLEQEGFTRDKLQMAWSFSTAPKSHQQERSFHMKQLTEQWLQNNQITYEITDVEEENCDEDQGRYISGKFTTPLFLEDNTPGAILTRDATGLPYINGETTPHFDVLIGCSLLNNPEQSTKALVEYGHGLLGTSSEMKSWFNHEMAAQEPFVFYGANWTGLSFKDSGPITLALIEDPAMFVTVPERTQQGWMEHFVLSHLMKQDDFMNASNIQVQNENVLDAENLYFYGNSAGAILGGGYAGLHGGFDKVVLGVGGMPFAHFLTRSTGFAPFLQVLETLYDDWREITLLIGLFEHQWEPSEAIGWVDELQDTPILLQNAIGDPLVPALGGHVMARAYKVDLVSPAARDIWGLEKVSSPVTSGRGLTEWDIGLEDVVESYPVPIELGDYSPHDYPRSSMNGIEQILHFFETGEIINPCLAACNPN